MQGPLGMTNSQLTQRYEDNGRALNLRSHFAAMYINRLLPQTLNFCTRLILPIDTFSQHIGFENMLSEKEAYRL